MYEQSQAIIHQSYEQSLKLEEIPGLRTVKQVLLKGVNKNKNTRVTNVHGSMNGQDILKLVESIEKEKKDKQIKKEKKVQQKILEKELFYSAKKSVAVLVLAKQKASKSALFAMRWKGQYVAKLHVSSMGKNQKYWQQPQQHQEDFMTMMRLIEESEVEGSEVLPLWRKKWEVPKYECIALHFQVVSEMDRAELKNSQ